MCHTASTLSHAVRPSVGSSSQRELRGDWFQAGNHQLFLVLLCSPSPDDSHGSQAWDELSTTGGLRRVSPACIECSQANSPNVGCGSFCGVSTHTLVAHLTSQRGATESTGLGRCVPWLLAHLCLFPDTYHPPNHTSLVSLDLKCCRLSVSTHKSSTRAWWGT